MPLFIDQSSQHLRLPPYDTINVLAWPRGHSMDWHQHDYLQFIHVLDGSLDVDWGDGWHSIHAHHVHILPPGQQHRLRSPSGHRQFGINFSRHPDERGLLSKLLTVHSQACVRSCASPSIDAVLHQDQHMQLAAIDTYCAHLLHSSSRQEDNRRQALLDIIDAHVHEGSDVEAWAGELRMSRASAQRHAHALFGRGLASLQE